MEDLRTAENVNTFKAKLKALSLPFYFGSHLLGVFFYPVLFIYCALLSYVFSYTLTVYKQ